MNTRSNVKPPTAMFELAFRPFFLFGALFSAVALITWALMLRGDITTQPYGGALWWHIHEMLFSFATAIIVGFLLTAVQNWTNVRSLNGPLLASLFMLWLIARVLFFFPELFPLWLIFSVDIIFLPAAAIALAHPIVKVKLWRNIIFIPILLLMAVINVIMHCAVQFNDMSLLSQASTTMVIMVTLVMTIMGGRVFPMFTANGTQTPRVATIEWLEKLTIGSTIAVAVTSFKFLELPVWLTASVLLFSALCHLIRVFRWKIWVTLKTPLVWSLHVSYWCIPIGFIMLALSQITPTVSHSQAIHAITVGAMGGMILSMISRVSMGHTGRAIATGKTMTFALVAIVFAFVIRVFGSYWTTDYNEVISTAVFFWVIAYGCFFVVYLPILSKPRR